MTIARLRPTLLALMLVILQPLAASAAGLPEPAASYRATQTIKVGDQEMTANIFHDRGKERREMSMQGMDSVMILRPAEEKGYILQPQLNMAMEMPLDGPDFGPDPSGLSDVDAVVDGQETVAGLDTTRYRVSGTDKGEGFVGLVWVTDDGIYARMDGRITDGTESADVLMELSDVVRGSQEPSLFEVPEGMRVMDMGAMTGRTPEMLRER